MSDDTAPVSPSALPAPPSPLAARAAYWAYDVVGGLAAVLAVPAWPWLRRRGLAEGIEERLGRVPAAAAALPAPPIWVHCASVGEALSAAPLVARLRERCPQRPLVVSTTTTTGRAVARDELRADVATLLPMDALRVVDRVFRRVRPRALLVVETELWPGLFRAAARVGAPIAIVSGRLSARTVERGRWAGPLLPAALARVAAFGMQTLADAERIVALGAPSDRVHVTGSLKAARVPPSAGPPPLGGLAERRLVIAASTQPGEEEFVLQAFAPLRRVYRDALLLVAPRRPERFDEAAALLDAARLRWVRRSAVAAVGPEVEAVLLDSLGELTRFFPAAWAVFVGGTVAPLGGHNVLEPAAHGRAVAFGPHTENVAAAAEALSAAGAAEAVRSPGELARYWDGLLARREAAEAAGERARAVALARAESLQRTWELLAPLLGAT
ncbi:3-deoxy-D-manno-octulosonic acid transferase [bacterium]|nr:3-deoxy-D-manno-octulosonic acid transferase [bacterium]